MADYKLTKNPHSVHHIPSGTHFYITHDNSFKLAYDKWVAEGNTPDPVDPEPLDVQNAPILAEIAAAESATLRAIREYILGDQSAVARLKVADDKIVLLRAKVKK